MTVMKVVKSGSELRLANPVDEQWMDVVPAGVYVLRFHPMKGFYLVEAEPFELPAKVYSNVQMQAQRIITSYLSRPLSTGVMLVGEKGSGKTLTAKIVCVTLASKGVPVILINEPYTGEPFNQFIQMLPQKAVIFFDEFEKTYNLDQQNGLLTLLDGAYPTNKLFILTANDKWKVGECLHNRPGRLYYQVAFKSLEPDFIVDYCKDNLQDQQETEGLVRLACIFEKFNFDMLQALVEEMNRFGESAVDAIKMLNIKPLLHPHQERFACKLTINGKECHQYDKNVGLAPLSSEALWIEVYAIVKPLEVDNEDQEDEDNEDQEDEDNRFSLELSIEDMVAADAMNGTYTYRKRVKQGTVVAVMTKRMAKSEFSYGQLSFGDDVGYDRLGD